MLHIINTLQALTNCLPFVLPGDAIILLEDGVYAAVGNIEAIKNHTVFALKNDLIIRGISDKIQPEIKMVNYGEFIELTIRFHPSQSWN